MNKCLLLLTTIMAMGCGDKNRYYTLEDYDKVEKIDVHIHVSTNRNVFVDQAIKDNFRLLDIVVNLSEKEGFVSEEYQYRLDQKQRHPQTFEFATAFSMKGWDDPNWVRNTTQWLDKCFQDGAIGVKVWKNIGMEFRDKKGELVMVDDPKLDSIFKFIAKRGKIVVGHLGEPKNCWLPLDEMTVNNDRIYYKEHPQYHMYKHPELPSYEEQIEARDRMLENNPDLIFMAAHLGSLEWSVDELAKRLDKFPNMTIDMAARIGQVFYQTIEDREKVRKFFIKYQDRILYGTDLGDGGKMEPELLQKKMHDTWMIDWQFLVTDDLMQNDRVKGKFRGLKLPKEVVDKIYVENALKWLKMFPQAK